MTVHLRRRGAFTLLEVMMALALLAISSLAFLSALGVGQSSSALSRERADAMNSIRAYLDRMRQTYPAPGSTDMSLFFADTSVPTPNPGILKNATAVVFKTNDETGAVWSAIVKTGGVAPAGSNSAVVWPANWGKSSTDLGAWPTGWGLDPADKTALGYSGNPLGQDLDGDGDTTQAVDTIPCNKILRIPIKILITWTSGSGGTQTMVDYAYLGPQR